ncbi:GNAT family N-acetyltransferase [Oerskovia sp. M15]
MSSPTKSTSTWRIVEAPHPTSLDAPEAWAYLGIAEVEAEVTTEIHGYPDLADEARDVLAGMNSQQFTTKQRVVAVRADAPETPRPQDVLGHLAAALPTSSNTHLGELSVKVRPAHRRHGIGTALWEMGEKILVDAGRTVLFTDTQHGVEPAPGRAPSRRARAPARPCGRPGPRFITGKGYALEQVERHSILTLPVDPALRHRLRAEAVAAAGPDYRTLVWEDDVPDAWREQVGTLFTRMSTDIPTGDIDFREDPWTRSGWGVGRRAARQGARAAHDGRGARPSATLAAFSVFAYPQDRPNFAFQEDTLVLREHRGHRLGMLVKIANLDALADRRPTTERIHTWNAEENDHMLAINIDLGFTPAAATPLAEKVGA